MSDEPPASIKRAIYTVSTVNLVVFVMNLGILTDQLKINYFDFKEKSQQIDYIKLHDKAQDETINFLQSQVTASKEYASGLERRIKNIEKRS